MDKKYTVKKFNQQKIDRIITAGEIINGFNSN